MKWNYVKENGVVNYRGDTMERLTFDGNFCDIAQCRELPCRYNTACTQRQVWQRLKQYEDSGLSPVACEEARKIEDGLSKHDYSIARMVELMQADKDGRVVVLPAKQCTRLHGMPEKIAMGAALCLLTVLSVATFAIMASCAFMKCLVSKNILIVSGMMCS